MLWRGLVTVCMTTLLLRVDLANCDGHKSEEKKDAEKSYFTAGAMYENAAGTASAKITLMQYFSRDGTEPKDVKLNIEMDGNVAELESLKVYVTKSVSADQCATWTMGTDDIDVMALIDESKKPSTPSEGNSSSADTPAAPAPPSRRRRDTEGPVVTSTSTDASTPTKVDVTIKDAGNLLSHVGNTLVFVDGDVTTCKEIMLGDTKGFMMLKIKFADTTEFKRDELVKMLAEKINMTESLIQVMKGGVVDGCNVVDVYFNSDFKDDEKLKKVYWLFAKDATMGYYSSTDKCPTEFMSGFIGKLMANRFAISVCKIQEEKEKVCSEGKDKDYLPEKSDSNMIQQLVQNYNKAMEAYRKRLNDYNNYWGIGGRDDREGRGCDGGQRQQDLTCDCSGDESQEYGDIDMVAFKYLAKYIGMGPREDLKKKGDELRELLNGRRPGEVDAKKVKMLSEKISELQKAAKERAYMTKYALCIISKSGNKSLEYLKMAKQRIDNAEDADEEGKAILKEKIMYAVEATFKKLASGDYKKPNVSKEAWKAEMVAKLQMIFGADIQCSSEEDRARVTMEIWGLNYTAPEYLKKMLEQLNITEISKFFEDADMFGEKFHDLATSVFSAIYVPFSVSEDATLMMIAKNFMEVVTDNAGKLLEKSKEILKEKSVEELMTIGTMLLSGDEIKEGCGFKDLAEKLQEEMDLPCNRDSNYGYGRDGDMGYGYGPGRGQQGRPMGGDWEYGRDRRTDYYGNEYYGRQQWNDRRDPRERQYGGRDAPYGNQWGRRY